MHKDLAQKDARAEHMQREIDQLRTEKTLLQDALDQANQKNQQLHKQVIYLESENDKVNQLRKLEKQQNQMHQSQTDLQAKVCENCIMNFSKTEEAELKLADAQRKVARLDDQLRSLQSASSKEKDNLVEMQLRQANRELEKRL